MHLGGPAVPRRIALTRTLPCLPNGKADREAIADAAGRMEDTHRPWRRWWTVPGRARCRRPSPRCWWDRASLRQSGAFLPGRAVLALIVALGLQVGVNYANDYSDGIEGTDRVRVGPVRLVGQGLARPAAVRAAAWACMLVAMAAGLALVLLTAAWWLLRLVGVACVLAAWLYTGSGPAPYGYRGLGEVFVFCFFGIVPVLGTVRPCRCGCGGRRLRPSPSAAVGLRRLLQRAGRGQPSRHRLPTARPASAPWPSASAISGPVPSTWP
jgi:hypothetical protein